MDKISLGRLFPLNFILVKETLSNWANKLIFTSNCDDNNIYYSDI